MPCNDDQDVSHNPEANLELEACELLLYPPSRPPRFSAPWEPLFADEDREGCLLGIGDTVREGRDGGGWETSCLLMEDATPLAIEASSSIDIKRRLRGRRVAVELIEPLEGDWMFMAARAHVSLSIGKTWGD